MQAMQPGTIIVDHTTTSAKLARRMHAAAQANGLHFLDAPVSGGEAGAINGALTVMVGGDEGPFEQARPIAANDAEDLVTNIGQNVFQAGFDALKRQFQG